jgi:Protein of unknown function (DUF1579)
MSATNQTPAITRDPALDRLDKFVGDWAMEGNFAGSDKKDIKGTARFEWLPGGFFLKQHIQLDFAGMVQIDSTEIVGYDPQTATFTSLVYSNMSPQPLPYTWKVDGDNVKITVFHGPMDATFSGEFADGGNRFGGSWRPNEGADEAVNVAYDIAGHRAT